MMQLNPQCALTPTPVFMGTRVYYLRAPRLAGCLGCAKDDCSKCAKLGAVSSSAVVSGGVSATEGILAAAAVSGPAAPIVAAVGAIAELILNFFGKGCGQACIESATLEQVPEVALDDLHAVALQQPGAISGPQFQEAWQAIISYGTQQLQSLQAKGDSKAADGIKNLNKSTDYSSFVASLPTAPTVALDLNLAQEAFTSPSAANWEPGSVSAGNSLALQILQEIASSSTAGSSVASTVTSLEATTGLSGTMLLLIAGGLAYFLLGRE